VSHRPSSRIPGVSKTGRFDGTFATLRGILEAHGSKLIVQVDSPGNYTLCSPTATDRIGRPLFLAAVQIKKSYVSFHLMPVYACPELLKGMSPSLRKRMQGKACFNFTTIEASHVKELAALTKKGLALMKTIKVPWAT
jgi:hypothetical protein